MPRATSERHARKPLQTHFNSSHQPPGRHSRTNLWLTLRCERTDSKGRSMKSFDEMQAGDEIASDGGTMTKTDIVNFVGMAGIKLPIFVDEEFCNKHSPFKTRIAPGFLVLALTAGMIEDIIGQAIAALSLDKIKFSTVVK